MKKRGRKSKKVILENEEPIISLGIIIILIGMVFLLEPLISEINTAAVTTSLDLSNYPTMFVSGGTFDGYLVAGRNSKVMDSLAMTDIASSMKIPDPTKKSGLTGDVWQASKLEMANSDSSTIQGENLKDLTNYIGKDDLMLLANGVYRPGGSTYPYVQYLYFDVDNTGTNELVKYAEDDEGKKDVFFYIGSGDNIGQYKLEFGPSAQSDIYDSSGSASTTGTVLKDFKNTKINLLGQEFNIVLANRPKQGSVKLILMGGALSSSLEERNTKKYQFQGKKYDVGLDFVDSTYAKFSVNGESTDKMQVGDTYKLENGLEIGVSEILYQDYSGGIHSANFFLGADNIMLRDDDVTDSEFDNELKVNGETISGAEVIITGADDGTAFSISTLAINMVAEDDYFVGANQKFSQVINDTGDNPKILFTNNWDIEFKGLTKSKSHQIRLDPSGSRKYRLTFYDGDGKKVSLPLYYAVDDSTITFGEGANENCLILKKGISIHKDDYFVLTGNDQSYLLQYKGADRSTANNPQIKFKNLGNKKTLTYSIDTSSSSAGSSVTNIKVGGDSFQILSDQVKTTDDFLIKLAGSGDVDVRDEYGAKIEFGSIPSSNCRNASVSSSSVTITTADSGDYGDQAPSAIVLTVGATTGSKVTIDSFTVGGNSNPLIGGTTVYGYTSMGGKMSYTSGSPDSFAYDYPKKQRLPLVYVTGNGTGTVKNLIGVKVVDGTRFDDEITDLTAQNLIVIGGACTNTIAAKLLGNPVNCTEGFTPGKAKIKLFKNGDKVAMLVAGYDGAGTRLAGKVIANRWTELAGKEVEIKGSHYNNVVITPVTK